MESLMKNPKVGGRRTFFFCSGEAKGESEALGRAGGGFVFQEGCQGAGRVSAGNFFLGGG